MRIASNVAMMAVALIILAGTVFSSIPSNPPIPVRKSLDLPSLPFALPKAFGAPITVGETIRALVPAYDPYDDCVGKWQNVWPRKTPGGGEPEKMGIGADPAILPYGTRVKFLDLEVCGFIHATDPSITDCTLTVDDTGSAATKDTARGIYHLELRVPKRSPDEDIHIPHERAVLFGRHDNVAAVIVSLPSQSR